MTLSATALVTLAQAKNYLRLDAAASVIVWAEYVGEGDGSETDFDLDNTPIDGTLKLYVNNVLQVETTDYSISTATITFVTAPTNGYPITANYEYAASSNTFIAYDDNEVEDIIEAATKIAEDYSDKAFIQRSVTEYHQGDGDTVLRLFKNPVASITSVVQEISEVLSDGDGLTVAYTLSLTPTSGSVALYVDAALQTLTTDYSVSGDVITFVSAPADGTKITLTYTHTILAISEYSEQLSKGKITGAAKWSSSYIYKIVYVAGEASTRAATQALVPDAVLAVLLIISDLYEHRGDTVGAESISGIGSTTYNLPSQSRRLLFPLKPLGGFV